MVHTSRWQKYRLLEQALRQELRISGEVEDLLSCSEKRFKQIVCNDLPLSSGRYYEFLFSCIVFTVIGDQFEKASIADDISGHFDAKICGMRCDFTMQISDKKKKPRNGIILIRFPHKCYHRGPLPKSEIASIVLNTIKEYGIPIVIDEGRLAALNAKIARFAY